MFAFSTDEKVPLVAEAYALDAVDIAAKNFQTKLDWTDDSIALVEGILDKLHTSLPSDKPTDDAIWTFAKAFGSYIGEVFRKNHGAEWGMVTNDAQSFPGLRSTRGAMFWPWGRVHQRILVGSENNVWHYYKFLMLER